MAWVQFQKGYLYLGHYWNFFPCVLQFSHLNYLLHCPRMTSSGAALFCVLSVLINVKREWKNTDKINAESWQKALAVLVSNCEHNTAITIFFSFSSAVNSWVETCVTCFLFSLVSTLPPSTTVQCLFTLHISLHTTHSMRSLFWILSKFHNSTLYAQPLSAASRYLLA